MKRSLLIVAFVAALAFPRYVAGLESPASWDLPESAVVRDQGAASRRAEAYFTERAADWEKRVRPYRAESVILARSPRSDVGLEKGDAIWIVVVVNDAESSIIQVPVGIVWVRAKDGAVFETEPKRANKAPEPTPPSVTPRASEGLPK